jgi:hypothetical protein
VGPLQDASAFQKVEILADGNARDAERLGQFLYKHPAMLLGEREDMLSALFDEQLAAIDSSRGMVIAVGSTGTNFARHELDLYILYDPRRYHDAWKPRNPQKVNPGWSSIGRVTSFGSTQQHRFAVPPGYNR